MGNTCSRTWVTPNRHTAPPRTEVGYAVGRGYPDVAGAGVRATGNATRRQSARIVPAVQDFAEDRLQVAGALQVGRARGLGRSFAPAPPQSRAHEPGY